jgi:hypothetical protein
VALGFLDQDTFLDLTAIINGLRLSGSSDSIQVGRSRRAYYTSLLTPEHARAVLEFTSRDLHNALALLVGGKIMGAAMTRGKLS